MQFFADLRETEPKTLFAMGLNFASSLSIVYFNKKIFLEGFNYSTTVVALHFLFTSIGIHLCAYFKLFEPKKIPFKSVLKLTLSFCGFVVLTNLSLQYNSVGFYQLMKILTSFFIIIIQILIYRVEFGSKIIQTVFVVILGVVIGSVTDFSFNVLGSIIALCGVIVTSFYQIVFVSNFYF
ncbi:solute carrier family 35 member e3 [Anaeramoeba ignava]|uniref:Solute carrier family 35 member e3 n=1 Tax=Anaeramoeba ignava TaxID=1746090 RepID=A0A9Q0RAF9_ANAIG|nr:solute carrier family 35 member e3 [Anaeramoeba ignava]